LESHEEEVEDLRATGHIEEIICATYNKKTKGQEFGREEDSPFHIRISVEPTTPCVTKKSEKEEPIRQPTIISRRILVGQGTSGKSSGSTNSASSS
jgi:hypothetical protein